MEKLFKLKENGTNIRTEIIAGFTTFMTMCYIIALNPNILTGYGANGGQELWNAVFLATCIASAIAMVCMALITNKPYCLAPGMGLNTFFALVVTNITALTGVSYIASFHAALVIILFEGILFLVLTLCNAREAIVNSIPQGVKLAISPAIGLMLMDIGLGSNVYIANSDGVQFFVLRDFLGSLTAGIAATSMKDAYPTIVLSVITMFVGLFTIVLLAKRKVPAAVVLGMLVGSIVYWIGDYAILGTNPFTVLSQATWTPPFKDMATLTLFAFDFSTLAKIGWYTVVTLFITFCMIDMFDTLGALIGTAHSANMVDENGNMPKMKQALACDSLGTIAGACAGTSTVTTFIESTAGIEAGGKTGLTSLSCAVLFLACMFIAPIAQVIPASATSAALIYVGILMIGSIQDIDFRNPEEAVPAALMIIAMPITSSIGNGIGIGLIAYSIIKIFSGEGKQVSILTYVISVLFLLKFFLVS